MKKQTKGTSCPPTPDKSPSPDRSKSPDRAPSITNLPTLDILPAPANLPTPVVSPNSVVSPNPATSSTTADLPTLVNSPTLVVLPSFTQEQVLSAHFEFQWSQVLTEFTRLKRAYHLLHTYIQFCEGWKHDAAQKIAKTHDSSNVSRPPGMSRIIVLAQLLALYDDDLTKLEHMMRDVALYETLEIVRLGLPRILWSFYLKMGEEIAYWEDEAWSDNNVREIFRRNRIEVLGKVRVRSVKQCVLFTQFADYIRQTLAAVETVAANLPFRFLNVSERSVVTAANIKTAILATVTNDIASKAVLARMLHGLQRHNLQYYTKPFRDQVWLLQTEFLEKFNDPPDFTDGLPKFAQTAVLNKDEWLPSDFGTHFLAGVESDPDFKLIDFTIESLQGVIASPWPFVEDVRPRPAGVIIKGFLWVYHHYKWADNARWGMPVYCRFKNTITVINAWGWDGFSQWDTFAFLKSMDMALRACEGSGIVGLADAQDDGTEYLEHYQLNVRIGQRLQRALFDGSLDEADKEMFGGPWARDRGLWGEEDQIEWDRVASKHYREYDGVARRENSNNEIDGAARQDNPNEEMYRIPRLIDSSDESGRQGNPNDEIDSGLEGLESD